MTSGELRVAVLGTGLIGTSIALAAARVGCSVTGWDPDPLTAARAEARGAFAPGSSLPMTVHDAEIVVVAAPVPAISAAVMEALDAAPAAIVTDVGSIKGPILHRVTEAAGPAAARFIPGHPMGGSERSGPEHASASVVDGIVWVLTPSSASDPEAVSRLEAWVARLGARPVRMDADRHDRLVAIVSHLPQVASTALMGLAAIEEADEPEILLLAAGGFRDLTRLAASNPALWSQILLSNRTRIAEAIDLYVARLTTLKDHVLDGRGAEIEAMFETAKSARLALAAKPQVRAGVAVWQVPIPDSPGSLARLTSVLSDAGVNIEDLQIVHSAEGGRGTVHLTVAATSSDVVERVLAADGFDPTRLA